MKDKRIIEVSGLEIENVYKSEFTFDCESNQSVPISIALIERGGSSFDDFDSNSIYSE